MTADPRAGRAEFRGAPSGVARLLDVILRNTLSEDPRAHLASVAVEGGEQRAYVSDPGYVDPFGPRCPDPWISPLRFKALAGMPPPPPLKILKAPAHVGRFALASLVVARRVAETEGEIVIRARKLYVDPGPDRPVGFGVPMILRRGTP